jgi:uncharacterized membrane protein YfcA
MVLAGAAAGALGALLGLGGGIILVPLLNAGFGLPFQEAAAISLVGVLATSSSVSAASASRRLLNPRLAVTLLVFSVSGAKFGASLLDAIPEPVFEKIFGVTAALVAAVMIGRLDKRNVRPTASVETGVLGGHFFDEDTKSDVVYRVRRLPLAAGASLAAGVLASFLGVGGGILVVPALNSWCGVPIRVAAATSAFMIGITAVPGVVGHWTLGHLSDFQIAGAVCAGVLVGYRVGLVLSSRVRVVWLKSLMAVLLLFVAGKYLFFR